MKWTRLDEEAFASEIPGAGCFVKFYTGHVCFVPNVTIQVDAQAKGVPRVDCLAGLAQLWGARDLNCRLNHIVQRVGEVVLL